MAKKKHLVGDKWRAKRKVNGKRRKVIVTKVARGKYKIRVTKAKNKHVNRGRAWHMDRASPYGNKSEPWERR